MRTFEQFDIEEPQNRFKPICNIQCCAYSSLLTIAAFLIPFLILFSHSQDTNFNYEFQITPDVLNQSSALLDFEKKLYELVDITDRQKKYYKQYSWAPEDKNYEMEDAMIKYRIWNDKNDLTLKLKDLFRENIEKVKINIDKKYRDTKKKIELNVHWKKMQKIYTTYSWQQSAKISNIDMPQISDTADILNYFPNADKIFNNCIWNLYNTKDVVIYEYSGTINNENVEFDLIFEDNGSVSFEYKWYEPLTFQTTEIIQKIAKTLI